MAQNRKFGADLALIGAMAAMGVCGTASALPEMDVGTLPPIAAPASVDTVDTATADDIVSAPEDVDSEDTAS